MFVAITVTNCERPSSCIRITCSDNARDRQCGQASGHKIRGIIEPRGRLAKIEVPRIGMADHRVQRVHCLVRHGERNAAKSHIKQRRNDAIARTLGHRLDHRATDLALVQILRVTPDDSRQPRSRSLEVAALHTRFERTDHALPFLVEAARRQTCPRQQHLQRNTSPSVKHACPSNRAVHRVVRASYDPRSQRGSGSKFIHRALLWLACNVLAEPA